MNREAVNPARAKPQFNQSAIQSHCKQLHAPKPPAVFQSKPPRVVCLPPPIAKRVSYAAVNRYSAATSTASAGEVSAAAPNVAALPHSMAF